MHEQLFTEARLLVQAVKEWAETLHFGVDTTVGMRAVLGLLLREGSMSVPDVARARLVSRQNIQQQVDALLDRKLVRREPNPAHKRSSLVALTDAGRALVQDMRAEELHALSRLQAGTSDSAMRDATQVLAAWKEALNNDTQRRSR
jgi:DNA-binding MarR family transcriptional regulator